MQVNSLSNPRIHEDIGGEYPDAGYLGLRADRRIYLCCCWVAVVVGERQEVSPLGDVRRKNRYYIGGTGRPNLHREVQLSGNRVARPAVNVKRRDRRWLEELNLQVGQLDRVIGTSRTTGPGSNSVCRRRWGALQRDRLEPEHAIETVDLQIVCVAGHRDLVEVRSLDDECIAIGTVPCAGQGAGIKRKLARRGWRRRYGCSAGLIGVRGKPDPKRFRTVEILERHGRRDRHLGLIR